MSYIYTHIYMYVHILVHVHYFHWIYLFCQNYKQQKYVNTSKQFCFIYIFEVTKSKLKYFSETYKSWIPIIMAVKNFYAWHWRTESYNGKESQVFIISSWQLWNGLNHCGNLLLLSPPLSPPFCSQFSFFSHHFIL